MKNSHDERLLKALMFLEKKGELRLGEDAGIIKK